MYLTANLITYYFITFFNIDINSPNIINQNQERCFTGDR